MIELDALQAVDHERPCVARALHRKRRAVGLAIYRRKRDFTRTHEPRGGRETNGSAAPRFVVQEHHASHLHYDFRLQVGDRLKSWAVPKGPSADPADRRLAVETEDHPLEYADFEGTIPAGEYGGGRVRIWDRGTWTPEGDAVAGLDRGRLTFRLAGRKLRGRWALVRMKARRGEAKTAWLLIKRSDRGVAAGRRTPASPRASRTGSMGLTHPDKVMFPEMGLTKRAVADYYEAVADAMLPELRHRPLTLVRCPDGRHRSCFFQKHARGSIPESVLRVDVGEDQDYLMVEDLASMLALVQLGVLELHVWGARAERLECPDRMVFDLDPGPGIAWRKLVATASTLRQRLEGLGLTALPRLSGGKGLHVMVPLQPVTPWSEVKAFARGIAEELADHLPEHFTTKADRKLRKGRIFVDYLRNARGATAIASYSLRAREGAPVAVPMSWREIEAEPGRRPVFAPAEVIERVRTGARAWPELDQRAAPLPSADAPEARPRSRSRRGSSGAVR